MDTERIAHLKDKLQTWPGEMALTSTDIADLLAILDEKAEQIKAGGGIGSGCGESRQLGSTPSTLPSPGLSVEDERAFREIADMVNSIRKVCSWLWGSDTMISGVRSQVHRRLPYNLAEVAHACAHLRSRLAKPAPPTDEERKEMLEHIQESHGPHCKICDKIYALVLAAPASVKVKP